MKTRIWICEDGDNKPLHDYGPADFEAELTERERGVIRGRIGAYLRECQERKAERVKDQLAKIDEKRKALEAEAAKLKGGGHA